MAAVLAANDESRGFGGAMTREVQKTVERRTVESLLAALGAHPDQDPVSGEKPDFTVAISGRKIGVEVTMFQSGATVEGSEANRRQAEAEWQRLEAAATVLRKADADLKDVNAILSFSGALPPRRQHDDFIAEVASFIRAHRQQLHEADTEFWNFSAPLMRKHLSSLHLRICPYAIWYTSLYAGYVSLPDSKITAIVAEKSAKNYQNVAELWLAIQCSTNISETVLPLGLDSFSGVPPLDSYKFERVFVLTYCGAFQWRRGKGWSQLTGQEKAA